MVDIVSVHPGELLRAAGLDVDLPAYALAGIEDGRFVACGGLAWSKGICWLFFHMLDPDPKYRFRVISCGKRLLRHARQLGETDIFVGRDASFASSERLLKLLGFEMVGEESGVEIWHCGI